MMKKKSLSQSLKRLACTAFILSNLSIGSILSANPEGKSLEKAVKKETKATEIQASVNRDLKLTDLPVEIIQRIIYFLDLKEQCLFQTVSKQMEISTVTQIIHEGYCFEPFPKTIENWSNTLYSSSINNQTFKAKETENNADQEDQVPDPALHRLRHILSLIRFVKISREALNAMNLARISLFPALKDHAPIIQDCSNLQGLDLSDCSDLSHGQLLYLISSRPGLKRLWALKDKATRDATLEAISEYCPNLSEIHLSYCEDLTDEGLIKILSSCKDLQSVKLDCCSNVTPLGLNAISKYCTKLEKFYFRGNEWDIIHENEEVLTNILRNLSCLKILDLSIEGLSDNINYAILNTVGEHCPKLEHIAFSYFYGPADLITTELVSKWKHLKSIKFAGEASASYALLKEIGEHCPNLVEIDLSVCDDLTDEGLTEILSNCKHLKSITLLNKSKITLHDINPINVKYPDLEHIEFLSYCKIEDKNLSNFVKCFRNLKSLILYANPSTGNETFISLATHCSKLKVLHCMADMGIDVTDEGICKLAEGCPNLESLYITPDVDKPESLTDKSILKILEKCSKLKELMIGGDAKITSKGFAALSLSISLRKLEIRKCKNFTETDFLILSRCSGLQELVITCTDDNIKYKTIERVRDARKDMTVEVMYL